MARLLYFGVVGDTAGCKEEELTLPAEVRTGEELRAYLIASRPALSATLLEGKIRLAVNQEIGGWDTAVSDADEIAFLPPMSGG